MNSKQQKTFESLLVNPVKKNIKWTDVAKLIIAVGGEVKQGDGSRIRIVFDDYSLNIHSPHPQKELEPYQIRAIRTLFVEQGIEL